MILYDWQCCHCLSTLTNRRMLGYPLSRYGIAFGKYSAQIADNFETASVAVRELFGCCSAGSRSPVEEFPKLTRSSPEGASNMSPSCVGADPKDSHKVPEPLSNHTDMKKLVFAGYLKLKRSRKGPSLTTRYIRPFRLLSSSCWCKSDR